MLPHIVTPTLSLLKNIDRLIGGADTDGILVHDLLTSSQTKISTADVGVAAFTTSDDDESMCIIDLNGRVNILKTDTNFISYSDQESAGGVVDNKIIRSMAYKIGFGTCGLVPSFAVPSKNGVCELFFRSDDDKWSVKSALEGENAPATHYGKDLNLAVFTKSGSYLATADVEGVIVVWKVSTEDGSIENIDAINQFSPAVKSALVDLVWSSEDSSGMFKEWICGHRGRYSRSAGIYSSHGGCGCGGEGRIGPDFHTRRNFSGESRDPGDRNYRCGVFKGDINGDRSSRHFNE